MYSLARFLQARGEHQDAESLHRQALAIYRQVHGEEHFKVATSLYYLARILVEEEQYAEAESYFRQAADLYRKTRPADDLWQVKPLIHLGSMLLDRGAVRRAEEPLRQALEIAGASSKADPDEVLTTKGLLGRTLTHLGRYEEAEALLMASYLGLKDRPAHEASAQRAVSYLITLYEQWQKPDEAATYRALQQHNAAAPASEPGR
jgi:tetratricopeptide (TPR) repeat protein